MEPIKPYKKEFSYSYALGAFPTMELLRRRPETARAVCIHSAFEDAAGVGELCRSLGVPVMEGDRAIARISPKENVYVAGVFEKFEDELSRTGDHLVLVNPGDMGNLGNMIRSALGFGFRDIAIITPAADSFHPRTVRASMGAIFAARTRRYSSYGEYRAEFPEHTVYCFMLDGQPLPDDFTPPDRCALVFGNEATGLPPEFGGEGRAVRIPQSGEVDSLNLTVAAGVGMYIFRRI